ncbi:MAG: hydrogenase expression/formation protein HypD [Rhodospirillaceae bacterium]|nr:MAG: hydrogenase expression/formation protein HypD [Rhodospirillaceae bacterium]
MCVTGPGTIDAALTLAERGAILVTFGDMIRVPGSRLSLAEGRAQGADIRVCYSPLEALALAQEQPEREVVFLAIGFETTAAPIIGMLDRAVREGVGNLSLLTALKGVPPALAALIQDPECAIDAFLCPGHVSAIIGANAYQFLAKTHHIPCVVAGFEALDILHGIRSLLVQHIEGQARVENPYARVVRANGNPRVQALIRHYLHPEDVEWRGLGVIPGSGLALRPAFQDFDAAHRFGLQVTPGRVHPKCLCGDVLKGKIMPSRCSLFGRGCHPDHPVGPCMVSTEGACAAHYKYVSTEGATE